MSYVAVSEPQDPKKEVSIVEEPDTITPLATPGGDGETSPTLVGSPLRQYSTSISKKKLTGRPHMPHSLSSNVIVSKISNLGPGNNEQTTEDQPPADFHTVLSQVVQWFHEEKAKRHKHGSKPHREQKYSDTDGEDVETLDSGALTPQPDSKDLALDKLEHILSGFIKSTVSTVPKISRSASLLALARGSIAKKFKRPTSAHLSSDTEFFGDEVLVPNVEAKLDNTKTMAYDEITITNTVKPKDDECWVTFKQDILTILHTMDLKGWRKIPIEQGADIEVSRLTGALTNAVYVVKPPKRLPNRKNTSDAGARPIKTPKYLLLRVYGPQAEHLIDRDTELAVLKRLAKKKIGPRLLGTFQNGRFEEYLNAETLTSQDVRVPDTSKSIAKRMRELHEGIELIEEEIEEGPVPFTNWDKFVKRCEKVITYLDQQVLQQDRNDLPKPKAKYAKRGYICGVEWPLFLKTYKKYREHVISECGGDKGLKKKLLFAHNDTQYGNLMRLRPEGESPLLTPANQHKQLVVIDFEYAGPSTVGYEFADHFSEWCYNYHDPEHPHICNTNTYPDEQAQYRFVRSYVMHRPQFKSSASATPKMEARDKTNISDFMLDARTPTTGASANYDAEEKAREKAMEEEIQRILYETRLWRPACSAHWIAWGIVQANVPEMDEKSMKTRATNIMNQVKDAILPWSNSQVVSEEQETGTDTPDQSDTQAVEVPRAEGDEEEDDGEFDNLAYAQDRAMFFWGDCLQLGLIKEEELPEGLLKKIKVVKY